MITKSLQCVGRLNQIACLLNIIFFWLSFIIGFHLTSVISFTKPGSPTARSKWDGERGVWYENSYQYQYFAKLSIYVYLLIDRSLISIYRTPLAAEYTSDNIIFGDLESESKRRDFSSSQEVQIHSLLLLR